MPLQQCCLCNRYSTAAATAATWLVCSVCNVFPQSETRSERQQPHCCRVRLCIAADRQMPIVHAQSTMRATAGFLVLGACELNACACATLIREIRKNALNRWRRTSPAHAIHLWGRRVISSSSCSRSGASRRSAANSKHLFHTFYSIYCKCYFVIVDAVSHDCC